MSEPIGAVHVDVLPRADDFVSKLRARIIPEIGKLGDDAGQEFARRFRVPVERDLPLIFPRTRRRTNDQGGKSGKEAGDAFGRELDARITAAIRALPDITIDAHTGDVEAKLAIIRQQLVELGTKKIGVDLSDKDALAALETLRAELDTLTGPEHDVRVRINAQAAAAELAKLKAEIESLDKNGDGDLSGDFDKSRKSAGLLKLAIIGIGPALIPLGAASIGVLGAAGGAVGTLALGIKGINTEIKAGTPLGKQWQASLHSLAGELTNLETTASRSFKNGFDQAAIDAEQRMPAITAEVHRIGEASASAAQHGVGALFAGFTALDPLIEQIIGDFDSGFTKLEKWADGGGLNGFVSWTRANLPSVEKDLAEIVKFVGDFLHAEAPQGLVILDVMGQAAHLGSDLLEVLGPLAPALTSVYIAMSLYGKLAPAIATLRAFSLASAAAGAGGVAGRAGLLGAGAGALARIAPYAAVAIGARLALDSLSKSTEGWALTSNLAERSTHNLVSSLDDLTHLNFSKFGKDISDQAYKHHSAVTGQIQDNTDLIGSEQAQLAARKQAIADFNQHGGLLYQPTAVAEKFPVPQTPELDRFLAERKKAFAGLTVEFDKQSKLLNRQLASAPLSQASEAWNGLQTSMQKSNDETQKFLTLGGPTVLTVQGVAIGEKTWDAALKESNGDKSTAQGLLDGLVRSYNHNQEAIDNLIGRERRLGQFQTNVASKYGLTSEQIDIYTAAVGLSADQVSKSNAAEAQAEHIIGLVSKRLADGNDALQAWVASAAQAEQGSDTLASRADLLAAGLKALRGVQLDMAGANLTAVSSAEDLATALDKNKGSVSAQGDLLGQLTKTAQGYVVTQPQLTKGSLELQQAMAQTGDSAIGLARSIYANTGNADNALASFEGLRAQFVSTAEQEGYTADQAENLAKQIFGIPSDAKTFVKLLGKDDVAGAIRDLTTKLAGFADTIAQAVVELRNGPAVSDDLDILNAKLKAFEGTHTATFQLNDGSSGSGGKTPRRAGGGYLPDGWATVGEAGWEAAYTENGKTMIFSNPASKKIMGQEKVPGFAGGTTPSLLVPPAPPTPSASSIESQTKLLITIGNVDVNKFLRALSKTASSIQSAEQTLVDAVTRAGGGASLAALLSSEDKSLLKLADARDALGKKLDNANKKLVDVQKKYRDEVTQVSGTITGAFDITTAGYSPEQILATLTRDEKTAALFKQQLAQVRKAGLNKNLLQQIAEKGLDAEPELLALSRASKSQIGAINSGYSDLGSIGKSIGTDTAESLYRAGINAARGLVLGIRSQRSALEKEMRALADAMVAQIKKALKINSPSEVARELGAYVGEGMALGIRDSHGVVRDSADVLATAALPGRGRGWSGRGGPDGHTGPLVAVYPGPGMDEAATGEAAARRIQMLGA